MGFGVPMENRAVEHLESLAPCTRKDVHFSCSYFLGSIRQIGWLSLPREEHWDFLGVEGSRGHLGEQQSGLLLSHFQPGAGIATEGQVAYFGKVHASERTLIFCKYSSLSQCSTFPGIERLLPWSCYK